MSKDETVKIKPETNEIRLNNPNEINLTMGGKGYTFKIKAPINIQGFIELFEAFVDVFDVSFTLKEEQFKKFPKSHIVEGSITEVNNLF